MLAEKQPELKWGQSRSWIFVELSLLAIHEGI